MADILIVDDDATVTEQITALLESFGYEALFLLESEYLFQMLEKRPVDLILMDINMPGIDGLTLLKQLKADPRYEDIPVIMLTGESDNTMLRRCFNAGAMDFIGKPFEHIELQARIKSALEIRNRIREIKTVNSLLKSTFDGLAEGVITLDPQLRIQIISGSACRILGITETEAIGKSAVKHLGAEVAGPAGLLAEMISAPEALFDVPVRLLTASGQNIPVTITIMPLESQSLSPGWLLLFCDLRRQEQFPVEPDHRFAFGRLISCDTRMKEIFATIKKIAASSAVVLIKGESGTGKELVAREIHDRSRRARGPFHAVNCAAISPQLMESEFFGHEKGAFTGASSTKPGRFELADKGTLFLDEVSDIPFELQGKLLRVLQEKEFERVGGTRTLQVDVRVLAATNRDLGRMVREGQFRDDLYYRLHVIPIDLPPLRERVQDIPLLVASLIETLNQKEHRNIRRISPEALRQLISHTWPGNVRELFNTIEYAFAVCDGKILQKKDLPKLIAEGKPVESSLPRDEKELILQALQKTNFNKPKAAALLGIHRATLYRKIRKYHI
ncbi:sigma-54-dependent Fis family transcriptional regulator [bacterium]|nr:sigma-54-dependent Fis family transcriptional regulator [bacterium]